MNRLHYLIEMSVQMANVFYYGHRILLLFPLQLLLFRGTRRDSVFNRTALSDGMVWYTSLPRRLFLSLGILLLVVL